MRHVFQSLPRPGQPPVVAQPWQVVHPPKPARYRGVLAGTGVDDTAAAAGARGPAARDARLARLEAVLLLASEPLSSRKLAQFTSLADGTEARTLVRVLNRHYDAQGTAFRVEEVAGGFQLLTRGRFGPWLRRLYQSPVEARLSSPALETLAVVAYRQPVLRAEIEAIRGVQSGEMLRQLMERDLVRITGRSPELGRPFLYGTTRRFLRMFGLRHLDEMPRAEALREFAVDSTLAAGQGQQTTDTYSMDTAPAVTGDQEIPIPSYRQEECEVKISTFSEPGTLELLDEPLDLVGAAGMIVAAKDEDEDDDDFEDEDEDEDDEDEDDGDDDDLEDDEWEEVDDEDEDDDFDDDDDDWDDEDDDDWDDEDEDEEDEDDDE